MQRLKKLTFGSYTLSVDTVGDDGAPVTAEAPFAVVVRDGAGAEVATGTPTAAAGTMSVEIPAESLQTLDTYELEWTAEVDGDAASWSSTLQLVGGYLFTLAQFRQADRAFENTTNYPADLVAELRMWVEDVIEGPRAAHVAFARRGARATVDGTGRAGLLMPDLEIASVYSVKVGEETWTEEQVSSLVIDDAGLYLTADSPYSIWPAGRQNIVVHYEHGRAATPGPITRAALLLAREYAVSSDVPGRATATSIGDQLFRLTIAGRDGVTGLPDVDAAIAQFGRISYRIG